MNIKLNVKGRLYNVQMWPIGGFWCHKHFKAQLYSTVFCSSLVCCFLWKYNIKKKDTNSYDWDSNSAVSTEVSQIDSIYKMFFMLLSEETVRS